MALTTRIYRPGVAAPATVPEDQMAVAVGEPNSLVWVDVAEPRPDELTLLEGTFGLHVLAVEDAMHAHQRPKLDRYEEHVFIAAYVATVADDRIELGEVGLFVGHRYLITIRHQLETTLGDLEGRLARAPADLRRTGAFLLYVALDEIVDSYFAAVDHLSERIGAIEDGIVAQTDDENIQARVFALRRDVLYFRRVVAPLREVIAMLVRADAVVAEQALNEHLRDLYDHVIRVYEELDTDHDLLGAALEAHLTAISNRLNSVVLKVSAWAAIIGVPTFIASLYGMNYQLWPFHVLTGAGFWFASALMGGGAASLYALFRRRRWL